MNSRRNFLKSATTTGVGALLVPFIARSAPKKTGKRVKPGLVLRSNSVIVFQGDSITDSSRDRKITRPNELPGMGLGYSLFAAGHILEKFADKKILIYNRGISGNKVYQLRERWDQDCIDLKPDVLSILIGVNDFCHTLTGDYNGTLEKYLNDYRDLLNYTKQKLPNVQLIIGEPYSLKGGTYIEPAKWYPMFDAYRQAARQLANEFNALFVPYQAVFDKAIIRAPDQYWSSDGVHPGLPGVKLMAKAWLKVAGLNKKRKKKTVADDEIA